MPERVLLGGTDGFRGIATTESGAGIVNPETFAGATYALLEYQKQQGVHGPLITARDTRPSSEALHQAVNAAGLAAGVEVWSLGVAPTPVAQKVAQEHGAMATVVVSASHNPKEDNGWKGMPGSSKPSRDVVAAISELYWKRIDSGLAIPINRTDGIRQKSEFIDWYIDEVIHDIERTFGAKPLSGKLFVVDGAYGAAQKVTPKILRRLGAEVEEFCCDGSGDINDGCGAANLDGLKQYLVSRPDVTANPSFIGALANDGDADRLMGLAVLPVRGGAPLIVEISGNHIMEALAQGQPGIVGTEYTNSALVKRLREQGIGFEYCANGDVFVTEALLKKQAAGGHWTRGGEFTGHLVMTDWLSSGDGVRMAAWFAAFVSARNETFADVYTNQPMWPETMAKVKFPGKGKDTIKQDTVVKAALAHAEKALGENGRIILRPSGTEPLVRVWAEGHDEDQIKQITQELTEVVRLRVAGGHNMAYPSTFTDSLVELSQVKLSSSGVAAISKLHDAGFEVVAGIRPQDVTTLTEIVKQPHVREYCPNDLTKRFGNSEMVEQWLAKDGGRALFLLRETATQAVRGFGWTRSGTSEKIADGATTFGIRLDERVSGRGLGLPFLTAILSGSAKLYDVKQIWGETWGSNVGAVKVYFRAGAELVTTEDDWRPTLKPTPAEANEDKRRDVRIFFKFPATYES
jgi:phosphoglucosamine mutase